MRRFATESTYAFLENLFSLAKKEGLDEKTTARWFRLVSSYCSGVALDEIAGRREQERADAHEAEKLREAFPRLAGVSTWLAPQHFDDVFEFGLDVLLDSLKEEAKTRRKSR
jgi:hypothetical protein